MGKSICSFAGGRGRLTFLKLGSASVSFSGFVWNFFETLGNQILVFQCDSEFRSVSLTPMYAMMNPYVVFCAC